MHKSTVPQDCRATHFDAKIQTAIRGIIQRLVLVPEE